jgi:hypothetical protein
MASASWSVPQPTWGFRVCLDSAHLEQSPGQGPVVAQLPTEVDQGLPVGQRCRDVMRHGQRGRRVAQLGPAGGGDFAGQELPAQAQAFAEQAAHVEELADVEQEPGTGIELALGQAPLQCASKVVVLGVEHPQPGHDDRGPHTLFGSLAQLEEER